ncbi:MAG: cardiolipin synthase, partial [Gammaproteobacteria bacterium]|nr:cardiolipin synthase [Gammaproteobacteria bacterium]
MMTPRKKRMIAGIVAVFYFAGIIFAIEATMKVRTAQGTIAWSVSLVSFPFVAVPAYLVFGRSKFEGMSEAFESRRDEFKRLQADIQQEMQPWEIPPAEEPSWHAAMIQLSG